jgi:hypothetical protein
MQARPFTPVGKRRSAVGNAVKIVLSSNHFDCDSVEALDLTAACEHRGLQLVW